MPSQGFSGVCSQINAEFSTTTPSRRAKALDFRGFPDGIKSNVVKLGQTWVLHPRGRPHMHQRTLTCRFQANSS
jgi:hypothetical protein